MMSRKDNTNIFSDIFSLCAVMVEFRNGYRPKGAVCTSYNVWKSYIMMHVLSARLVGGRITIDTVIILSPFLTVRNVVLNRQSSVILSSVLSAKLWFFGPSCMWLSTKVQRTMHCYSLCHFMHKSLGRTFSESCQHSPVRGTISATQIYLHLTQYENLESYRWTMRYAY